MIIFQRYVDLQLKDKVSKNGLIVFSDTKITEILFKKILKYRIFDDWKSTVVDKEYDLAFNCDIEEYKNIYSNIYSIENPTFSNKGPLTFIIE